MATDRLSSLPLPPPRPGRPRRPVMRLMSAGGSLVVHAILLAVFAAVVWRTAGPPALKGPDISLSFDAPALGEAPTPAPASVPSLPEPRPLAREVEVHLEPAPPIRDQPLPVLDSLAATPSAPVPAPSTSPAPLDFDASAFTSPPGVSGPAAAASTDAAPEGGVTFGGLGASNARSVVYVVDASGSMVTSLPFVLAEVQRSVAGLAPTQKFGVVLFRRRPDGADGLEVFAPILVRATPSARERLRDWLASVQPLGRSVPLSGLERGLAYKPEAIFLLSRSIERSGGDVWGEGVGQTLARIDALNPSLGGGRPVVIQTLQFLDDDPTGTMQEIGRIHGSHADPSGRSIAGYRVVRRGEELGVAK